MKTVSIMCRCIAVLAVIVVGSYVAAGNPNPGVLPPNSKPAGKSNGQWSAEWWKWALGIPAAQNPILDETGEFGHIGQRGHVWFLAGNFGGTTERTVTIPAGKMIFFPILNSLWWAPEDLGTAEFVAEYLGLDPDTMTDEELIRLVAQFTTDDAELTCTLDGRKLKSLDGYYAETPAFRIFDTDLLDDLGIPISQPNLAVGAGYWIMLAPLSVGKHELRFTGSVDNPLFGVFALDVTYHITVKK